MTRRTMLLLGVAAVLTLTAGGAWATWASARSAVCPPHDMGATAMKTSCCGDDLDCPSGCALDSPPDCRTLTTKAKAIEGKTKSDCPPCPFCNCPPCPFCP